MHTLIHLPAPTINTYIQDSDHPRLLAHIDELGRACCYHPDGGIRYIFKH